MILEMMMVAHKHVLEPLIKVETMLLRGRSSFSASAHVGLVVSRFPVPSRTVGWRLTFK